MNFSPHVPARKQPLHPKCALSRIAEPAQLLRNRWLGKYFVTFSRELGHFCFVSIVKADDFCEHCIRCEKSIGFQFVSSRNLRCARV